MKKTNKILKRWGTRDYRDAQNEILLN